MSRNFCWFVPEEGGLGDDPCQAPCGPAIVGNVLFLLVDAFHHFLDFFLDSLVVFLNFLVAFLCSLGSFLYFRCLPP